MIPRFLQGRVVPKDVRGTKRRVLVLPRGSASLDARAVLEGRAIWEKPGGGPVTPVRKSSLIHNLQKVVFLEIVQNRSPAAGLTGPEARGATHTRPLTPLPLPGRTHPRRNRARPVHV